MRYIRPRPLGWALLPYVLGGLLIGASLPWLKPLAAAHLGRAGFAIAFVVNLAMPALVVGLSALYPRTSTALLGTALATTAFLAAVGLPVPPLSRAWLAGVLGAMGPILTLACVMYHALAVGTTLALRPFRRVGLPRDPAACRGCGYALTGLTEPRCPECFSPIDRAAPPDDQLRSSSG